MRKGCRIGYAKFGGAARRRFPSTSEKPERGWNNPPRRARVNPRQVFFAPHLIGFSIPEVMIFARAKLNKKIFSRRF